MKFIINTLKIILLKNIVIDIYISKSINSDLSVASHCWFFWKVVIQ